MATDDLYDEAPSPARTATPRKPTPDKEDEGESETALLPKSLFASEDLEVGDRYTIEISAIHDEEVSVALEGPAEPPPEEEEPPAGKPPVPAALGGGMDAMLE